MKKEVGLNLDIFTEDRYRRLLIDDNAKRKIYAIGSQQPLPHEILEKREEAKKSGSRYISVSAREELHAYVRESKNDEWECITSIESVGNDGNKGRSYDEIKRRESEFLKYLKDKGVVRTENKGEFKIEEAISEEEFSNRNEIEFLWFPCTDHTKPNEREIEAFVKFFKFILDGNEDVTIHFHCRGGRGRTTTFMLMLYMMANADKLSFEEILERIQMAGGSDILNPKHGSRSKSERVQFLKQFCQYCRENKKDDFMEKRFLFIIERELAEKEIHGTVGEHSIDKSNSRKRVMEELEDGNNLNGKRPRIMAEAKSM